MSDYTTPAVPATSPTKVSPKVIVSTILALLVPGILATITYVGANQDVLGINNPILGVFITAFIPGLLTFVGGYATNDPARNG
jgi:hypothetical protein